MTSTIAMALLMSFLGFIHRTSLHEVIVLLAVISAIGLQMDYFADDPGVGWHLETGRWVLEHAGPPRHDPFLAVPLSQQGAGIERSWVSDQWFSDGFLFFLFDLGSWPFLYSVLALIYLVAYLLVLHRGLRRLGVPALASTFAVLCAFKLGQIHFILRPVMFGFLLFILVYLKCLFVEQNPSKSQHSRSENAVNCLLWGVCFSLWASIHPSFVLGLLLLAMLCAVMILRAFLDRAHTRAAGYSLGLMACAFIGTLVNPYGIDLYRSILALRGSEYFMNLHQEWLPITFASPEGQLYLLITGIIAVGLTVGRGERRAGTLFALATVLVFAFACFDAVRMAPFFGIVASYPLACALSSIGRNQIFSTSRPFARLARAFYFLESREQRGRGGVGVMLGAAMLLLTASLTREDLLVFKGPFGPSASRYPYEGVSALLEIETSRDTPALVVASISEWGGFLTHFGGGKLKPLFDDRNALIGESFHREYSEQLESAKGWEQYFVSLGADALLVPRMLPLAKQLIVQDSELWRVVYLDKRQVVALRR